MVLAEFSHLSRVTTPLADDFWWIQKMVKKGFLKDIHSVVQMQPFFSTYLFKDQWENILEVQLLRYSKIMLGNCCNIRFSLLSSIMSCHQWVIRSPDWTNHSFLTATKLFSPTLPLHTLLPSPSVSHGRPNFRPCPMSHEHWTWSKFRPSGHRSHPRPNQSKWYSMPAMQPVHQKVE